MYFTEGEKKSLCKKRNQKNRAVSWRQLYAFLIANDLRDAFFPGRESEAFADTRRHFPLACSESSK